MGYLDQYEQGPRGFDKIVKAVAFLMLAGLLGYSLYWLFFRNWAEERVARTFLETVVQKEYEQAYAYWGCTIDDPCRYYPYDEFLEDWGPESPLADMKTFELGRSYTQPNGVIIEVTIDGVKQPNLWVESDTKVVGFFPY